jgi:hydroxymethylpyrimidine/phosphomethylpyrimidine kinase
MTPARKDPRPASALTIAGSDPGGGAGIQADLKTFAALRVHGLAALAALTAQNTQGVTAVHVPPVEFLRAQVDACFGDFRIGAVKIGMLATADVVRTVVDLLEAHRPSFVVLDPVMIATSGARLLADDAVRALRMRLLPLASVITPNIPEAEALLGRRVAGVPAMREAAKQFLDKGAHAVLLKGGHLEGDEVVDVYTDAHGTREIVHARLPVAAHGTGCTLAAAIAANLCRGRSLPAACVAASDFVHRALAAAYKPGRGDVVVLDPFAAAQP